MNGKNKIERAKISLPLDTSAWIRDLQKKHKIRLSLSQIVARGMEISKAALTKELAHN